MTLTAEQIAEKLHGTLSGNGMAPIRQVLPIGEAQADSLTFVANQKSRELLADCNAAAVLYSRTAPLPAVCKPTLILVDDPMAAVLEIARLFLGDSDEVEPGIDPQASVHPTARIGAGAYIGPFAVIEANVAIGAHCKIHPHAVVRRHCVLGEGVEVHPHAVLYPRTKVGAGSVIHGGAVIGCDGFGYTRKATGHQKIPQLGAVEIGDHVEIGANSTIDRATIGATRVGDGTKVDNLVMIGHNCQIGKHNIFVSQAGMAGSCTTGEFVVLAGQAGVADHVHLGAGCILGAKAGVFQDVPAGESYLGAPARPERDAKRRMIALERLPDLAKQVHRIATHLGLDEDANPPRRRAAG